jgi:nucleotide-binding universal stress UspA family protein
MEPYMTQTTERRQPLPMFPPWTEPGKAVVVGVDGSRRNRAAIEWAAEEATACGRPLNLLLVIDDRALPMPPHGPDSEDMKGWRLLNYVATELANRYPDTVIRKEMAVGADDVSLIGRSEAQASLVVGRRGLGTFARLLVGSTSLSVAGHSRVPVIVVPDDWSPEAHAAHPVIVGIDHQDVQPEVLRFAFVEARRRGVPVIAAYGREAAAPESWPSPEDTAEYDAHEAEAALERALMPYRREFPGVEVRVVHHRGHPLSVLLDEVGPSQLLVLGRHSSRRRGGFPFGSVARGVLYYADSPVAIVPSRTSRSVA